MKKIPSSSICIPKSRRTLPVMVVVTGTVAVMVLGMSGGTAFAAAAASDSASNYTSVWSTSPPNYGSGFGNWTFFDGASSGMYNTFLAGISDTPIVDGGGNAWALNAEAIPIQGYIDARRAFLPGPSASAALFNQTISFDMAVSGVPSPNQNGPYGYFAVSVGSLGFGFQEDAQNAPYTYLINSTGNIDYSPAISLAQWEAGLAVSIAISGPLASPTENYTLTVSPFSGGGPIYSNSGTFNSASFIPSSVTFEDNGLGGNGYFNSINITPEPAPEPAGGGLMAIGLIAIGVVGGVRRVRGKSVRA